MFDGDGSEMGVGDEPYRWLGTEQRVEKVQVAWSRL
jgi:hypothetical protein